MDYLRFTSSYRALVLRLVSMLPLVVALHGCEKSEQPRPPKSTIKAESPIAQPSVGSDTDVESSAALNGDRLSAAQGLYERHCSGCHGVNGDGAGLAARFLFPRPRDFRSGQFRVISTINGFPTLGDLEAVLLRGMPGSSMPPWPALTGDERRLLAQYVIAFRREGIREAERASAAAAGEEIDLQETEELVDRLTTPGPLVDVSTIPAADAEAASRGRESYLKRGCAACHGSEGKGDGQQTMVDAEGLPTRPRDLTRGIFKGSPAVESVYRRILAGMPGSPMPATRGVLAGEIADMVRFVLSLSDEATRAATVLNRQRIVAHWVDNAPASSDAAAWNEIAPVRLRLTPLWWRNEFTPDVSIRAVHDGETFSLQASWTDPTPNTHAGQSESFRDALSIGFHRGEFEPFLGMGMPGMNVDVWMWDADRQKGWPTVEDVYPNVVVDVYPLSETAVASADYSRPGTLREAQPDLVLPARAVGNLIAPRAGAPLGTAIEVVGAGSVTFRPAVSQIVQAEGRWENGRWTVAISRKLKVDAGAGVSLEPGESASLVVGIWDGSHKDRDGQKLITIWQDLELETMRR